jgi:hypothetical protein
MGALNAFITRTIKWFLIIAGLATCATLPFAIDINLFTPMLAVSSITPLPAFLRCGRGIMIFGLLLLMVVAAFRPWLRFETMLFCTAEKSHAHLFLSNPGQPWVMGHFGGSWSIDDRRIRHPLFLSEQGRLARWSGMTSPQ